MSRAEPRVRAVSGGQRTRTSADDQGQDSAIVTVRIKRIRGSAQLSGDKLSTVICIHYPLEVYLTFGGIPPEFVSSGKCLGKHCET